MRRIKRLIATLISISLISSILPNIVFADDEIVNEVTTGISSTLEPVDKQLLNDTEQVITPVEIPDVNEVTDNTETETDSTDKSYEMVDELPSEQQKSEMQNTFSSSYSERELYDVNVLKRNAYNPRTSQELSINPENGNVGYSYNIASIPGANGSVMSLDIEYNSTESLFVRCLADITDAQDYYVDPCYEYVADESLGAGWKFSGIKRRDKFSYHYYTLRDGNVVDMYDDDYLYYKITNNTISYIDGTIERLNDEGYLESVEDKYGNIISYEYEDYINAEGKDAIRLKSITDSLNRSITVDYYENYIEITRPDATSVRLKTKEIPVEHIAEDRGYDWTMNAKVITSIYSTSGKFEIANFDYQSEYFRYSFAPAGRGISGDDYGAYMPMTKYTSAFNESHYLDYDIIADDNPFPMVATYQSKAWYLCAVKDYSNSQKTDLKASYSYDIDELDIRSGMEICPNGRVTKYTVDYSMYTNEIYERKNNVDTLLHSTETYRSDNTHRERPEYIMSKIYNSNGNYITKQIDYEYDRYGNVTKTTEKVDDTVHLENEYTYNTDTYKSLKNATTKKGTTIFNKIEYTVNSLGDVTSEEIYDGENNLQRDTRYQYSNNKLISKTLYNPQTNVAIWNEKYSYTGPYMTRKYSTQAGTVLNDVYYTYNNDNGRLISTSDVNKTETVEYDALGRIISEKHSDGTFRNITYSVIDTVVAVTDENKYKNHYWYNNQGKLSRYTEQTATEDAHVLQRITYDTVGNPINVTDALNNTTDITYDVLGRQTNVKYPGNTATTKAKYYDVFLEGNDKYSVYLTISETGRIACEYYDIYGRRVKTALVKNYSAFTESDFDNIYQMPSNAQLIVTSRYVYDDLDRVIEQYDGENRPTYYTYDSIGNVINMVQGVSGGRTQKINISYEYDSSGNLTKVTQGTHKTTYEYDLVGRLVKMTDPMGYTETYTYDTAGNIKTATDKNGTVTTNTYNNRGFLSKTVKNGEYIEYTYDGVGNVLTSKDKNGIISYTYNKDGTLASKKYPDGKTITYNSYNGNKALTSMTDYLGNTTTYTYNDRGAVTAIGEKYTGTSTVNTTKYTYNTDGSLQKVTYPLSSYMATTYTYDYAGRISNLTNKLTSAKTYSTHTYTYDSSGNVTKKIDNIEGTSKTVQYTYDTLNRVASETASGITTKYFYDQYSNLTEENGLREVYYSYDRNNRLTFINEFDTERMTADGLKKAIWEITLSYDKNGDLQKYYVEEYPTWKPCNTKTYTYDAWGRLTNFSDDLGETASYGYYSDGLRASKTVGSDTTKYYYDGDNIINETLNGSSYATNVLGVDGYISRKQNGTTGYLFKNAHGDVVSAYSSTTNKLADYTYDAWGEQQTTGTQVWGMSNPIRYNGQYYDTESGMTYLRARYYDSSVRRFITEDPIRDGVNWYSYAGNNPVMFVDPSGYMLDDDYRDSGDIDYINKKLMYITYVMIELDTKTNEWDINNCYNEINKTKKEIKDYLYNTDIWRCCNVTTVIVSVLSQDTKTQSIEDINALLPVTVHYRGKLDSGIINPEVDLDKLRNIYDSHKKPNTLYLAGDFIYREKMIHQYLGTNWPMRYERGWKYNGKIARDLYEANEQEGL